ncbi:MAG: hypothetical protein V4787_11525 [Pseudomonadota bacterium]
MSKTRTRSPNNTTSKIRPRLVHDVRRDGAVNFGHNKAKRERRARAAASRARAVAGRARVS